MDIFDAAGETGLLGIIARDSVFTYNFPHSLNLLSFSPFSTVLPATLRTRFYPRQTIEHSSLAFILLLITP